MIETEVVIAGIAGRFPESDSVSEFSEKLYSKVNVVTESSRRWEPGLNGLPRELGQIKDLSKFDAEFFGIHPKQAHLLDPQGRMLLELTYEAIVDAGIDPQELKGKKIGVFIGSSMSESEQFFAKRDKTINTYAMIGCSSCTLSNHISFVFDFKGPSFTVDTACSSAALAFNYAVKFIRNNECEAAIVGGSNLCLRPTTSLQFLRTNMLSPDGTCKSFDVSANGYARSESVAVLFLQKFSMAKRVYASVIDVNTNTDGYKENGFFFPSGEMQKKLFRSVYNDCCVNPLDVSYVEAHGTGTPVGDSIEISTIDDVFCTGRKEPLFVGSVKSNIGHSEAASGICGIIKIVIAMESGILPPNLHFKNPNPNIPALIEGRVKIVTDPTPWKGGYASLNSFGFGGVNVHAILKSNTKEHEQIGIKFPQLVLYSGRTEKAIKFLFDYLDKNSVSRDFFALLHNSVYSRPQAKPYRGYKVLGHEEAVVDTKQFSTAKRPVWYVFSGMGTQWPAMARDLMSLDIFSKTIHRMAEVLKPFNINLLELLTSEQTEKKENARAIIPAFVTIAAVQVALVDVLTALGIKPDGMIGHSIGELGCAYADGCFTGEQMVLSAYWRGKAIEDSDLVEGAMAAIGMTWEEAKEQCPGNVFPTCHNAKDSVTISGPKGKVQRFLDKLKAANLFAREVNSCGYAFHSEYVIPAAEKLQRALELTIPKPKRRTARWVSSSYLEKDWNDPKSQMADASYFVHNLVSPVMFYEALCHVPKDAVVIEIAPHHLLQAILKRVIGPKAEFIGMMKRHTDNSLFLLSRIGRMYTSGLNPYIEKLYPPVFFPVPRGTPNISSLIKWDHSVSWTTAYFTRCGDATQIEEVDIGAVNSEDAYLVDHCLSGRILYPASGYLVLVWKALANLKNKNISTFPVQFENVEIHRATPLSKTSIVKLLTEITSSGHFEIYESESLVASGRIYELEEKEAQDKEAFKYWKDTDPNKESNYSDFYKVLRLLGYEYGPTFKGIKDINVEGDQGLLTWSGNWVTFLDTIIQFIFLARERRVLELPTKFAGVKINPILHMKMAESTKDLNGIPVCYNRNTGKILAGGVEINNFISKISPRQTNRQVPIIEEYHFVPNYQNNILLKSEKETVERYIHVCSSIAKNILESTGRSKDQILDVMNEFHEVEIDEDAISFYLQNHSEKCILLKSLQQMCLTTEAKELNKMAKLAITSYLRERELDIINQTLLSETSLRTVLDIVTENTNLKKLNVFEIHDGNFPLSVAVCKVFQNFHSTPFSYTVAHPNPAFLDIEIILSNNLQTLEWSLNNTEVPDLKAVDLLLLKDLACSKEEFKDVMKNLSTVLKDNSFILIFQKTKLIPAENFLSALSEVPIPVHSERDLEQIFKDLDLPVVAKKSDGILSSIYLLRKLPKLSRQTKDAVVRIHTGNYNWVEELKIELSKARLDPENHRLWLVSEKDANNGIIGLVNCLRQEPGGICIRCVFTDCSSKLTVFEVKSFAYDDVVRKDLLMNVFKNGIWGSFRHIPVDINKNTFYTEHAYLNILTRGNLSSFKWIDSPLKHYTSTPNPNTVLCHVYYASLNFRDVMLATGKLPSDAISENTASQDCILGLEFSGRNMKGERIMGLATVKGLATIVAADPVLVWKVPDNWTLEEGSTVPVAYSTAYYALVDRGNLKKGEKVLIHSGSGGVGQAAISIALSIGCQIFTSVGSNEKREFLKKRFPQLSDTAFCNSRDTSFEQHILNSTNGKGVDVVLNSLADEKLKATLRCVAKHGRFLEIGKYDLSNNTGLGMAVFLKNISFHGILLDSIIEDTSMAALTKKKDIVRFIDEGIRNGTVKPLNCVSFNKDQAEQAFRFMAKGHHMGKVVLKIRDEESKKITLAPAVLLQASPRTSCDPKKIYIIIGGLGGFGLELCNWLIDRGATNVILTSRSGIRTGYQRLYLKWWKKKSTNVIVSTLDVTDSNQAIDLLKLASKHGLIGGIFNLALVLRDALMKNQTAENFTLVCQSKIQSTINLDALSRKFCPHLDWFVCFSSISCGRGNAGQSNYGFANSVMERICEQRKQEGYPGLAIQWGAIGDVGVFHETIGSDAVILDTVPQRIISCLEVLDQFLSHEHPVVSSFISYRPSGISDLKTEQNALATVANVFGIKDIRTINMEVTLGELGLDSLMSVEIQQFLERQYQIIFSSKDIQQLKMKDIKKLDECSASFEEDTLKKAKDNESPMADIIKKMNFLFNSLLPPVKVIIPMNEIQNGIPLFIIHPIEGGVTVLKALAKLIMCPVYGLQYTADAPLTSVVELASWYLTQIKAFSFDGPVNIAGYSFGATVAFEIMAHVEQNPDVYPKIKSVIMLDGSPCALSHYLRELEPNFSKTALVENEIEVIYMFMRIFIKDVDIKRLTSQLLKLPNLGERNLYVVENIIKEFSNNLKEDVLIAAKLFCRILLMSVLYSPKHRIQKDVTLIKAAKSVPVMKDLSEKYHLENVCMGKITVHIIPGDHTGFIQGVSAAETAKIINSIIHK